MSDEPSPYDAVVEDLIQLSAERLLREVERLAAIAFPLGCRVAIRPDREICVLDYIWRGPSYVHSLSWDFVILGPGESPPGEGRWVIYEDRGGIPFGRTHGEQ